MYAIIAFSKMCLGTLRWWLFLALLYTCTVHVVLCPVTGNCIKSFVLALHTRLSVISHFNLCVHVRVCSLCLVSANVLLIFLFAY